MSAKSLERIKRSLLEKKEERAKARGRLDQLLDGLQKQYGIRSLVEARGMLLELERKKAEVDAELEKESSELEEEAGKYIGEE